MAGYLGLKGIENCLRETAGEGKEPHHSWELCLRRLSSLMMALTWIAGSALKPTGARRPLLPDSISWTTNVSTRSVRIWSSSFIQLRGGFCTQEDSKEGGEAENSGGAKEASRRCEGSACCGGDGNEPVDAEERWVSWTTTGVERGPGRCICDGDSR